MIWFKLSKNCHNKVMGTVSSIKFENLSIYLSSFLSNWGPKNWLLTVLLSQKHTETKLNISFFFIEKQNIKSFLPQDQNMANYLNKLWNVSHI